MTSQHFCSPTRTARAFQLVLLGALTAGAGHAQQHTAILGGVVTDPTGALVTTATVTLHPASGRSDLTVATTHNGRYTIAGEPGTPYTFTVTAPGFAPYFKADLELDPDRPATVDVQLKIAVQNQQIAVSDDAAGLADPNRNGDSLVLNGAAIDRLPLDSAVLMQQLQALSGGPSPEFFVDGFSGASLPPRDTIREIRINQNPYSAQYDTAPGTGRIEVFTKPGTGQFHGDLYTFGNASGLNTRAPFTSEQPSYYSYSNNASLGGPLTKHLSFYMSGGRTAGQDDALINAQVLDSQTNIVPLNRAVSAPVSTYNFTTRMDASLGAKSTVIARYSLSHTTQSNAGVGLLSLESQGFATNTTIQTLQISNAQVISPKVLNDTRFQYTRSRDRNTPNSTSPAIAVSGAFIGGGNVNSGFNDNQDRYELQNYLSASIGKQFLTLGGRFRATREANRSQSNYNGTFTFARLAITADCTKWIATCNSYQATKKALTAPNMVTNFSAIQAMGGGASQFAITRGDPNAVAVLADTALFLQDDWKPRPNLTVSGGLRFETQNHIADRADWAPRLGLAWSLPRKGKPANYTIRGGAGIFYHRFAASNVLQSIRLDGIRQSQFVFDQPSFYFEDAPVPSLTGSNPSSTIYQISPAYHAPYSISTTASVERRAGKFGTVTVTWIGIRGVHTQLQRNINAPLPGTYDPAVPASGTRPLGGANNIYQYASDGFLRSNRLTTNFNLHFRDRIFAYGFYQFQSQHGTSDAAFVSDSYNLAADYGRTSLDIRHQATLGASATLPFSIHANSFVRIQSGAPFNFTVGQDLNGDSIFNDRPAFATDLSRSSVVVTPYGNFDTRPTSGQTIIPINYGNGPGLFVVNLIVGKTFSFGPTAKLDAATAAKAASGQKTRLAHRYSLDISVEVQNIFNHVNLAAPIGNLNSPWFGKSIALANVNNSTSANRVIEISSYFRF